MDAPKNGISSLCSSCQSLLTQRTRDPKAQVGNCYDPEPGTLFVSHLVSEIMDAAVNGCVICQLVITIQETMDEQSYCGDDPVFGFIIALYWSRYEHRFTRIELMPFGREERSRVIRETMAYMDLDLADETNDTRYSYPCTTNTHEAFQSTAMTWFNNCLAGHAMCQEQKASSDQLPSRLIDVGLLGDIKEPRLVLASELQGQDNICYTTLSHRWTATGVVTLKSGCIDSFRRRIPLESLSANFLDAIDATKALGFQYLWIDSLCILQDSLSDWQIESVKMGNIYKHGVCNFAATASSKYGGGLFQNRDSAWACRQKVRIQYDGHDMVYLASIPDLWGTCVSRTPLHKRGWVFQERMLSPRTLHFGPQLFWECRKLLACQTYPEGLPDEHGYFYEEADGFSHPLTTKNWLDECKGSEFWNNVVEIYGRCRLTKPDDRLIAVAGIAKTLQPVLNDRYLAGLWERDLPYNLAWGIVNVEGEVQRSRNYRCPSWSWAALDYTCALLKDLLIYSDYRVGSLVRILEVSIDAESGNPFGLLRSGYILLKGRLGRTVFLGNTSTSKGEWIDGHYSFEWRIDTDPNLIDNETIYCFPLYVRSDPFGPENQPLFTDCLLIERFEVDSYRRVGVLKVSLELEDVLPQELRWIPEHAKSQSCLEYPDIVKLY